MVEICRNLGYTPNETRNNPQLKFALHLRTATVPHKQLQPAKLRDAPDAVCEGVGCARQQSWAARNNSQGVLVNSKLRASITKNPKSQEYLFSRTRAYTIATSSMKTRLSPNVCCSSGRYYELFWARTRNICGK